MGAMYDAVDIEAIPADAQIVGAYVNGKYRNIDQAVARFPHALIVPIRIYWPGQPDPVGAARADVTLVRQLGFPTGSTFVLDIEAGDAEAAMESGFARIWASGMADGGYSPEGYTSASTWDTIQPAGFIGYWIAHYTNRPHLLVGANACQWTAPETGSPGDYDISECVDGWPHRGNVRPDPRKGWWWRWC